MEKLVISIFPYPSKRRELLSACRMIASRTFEEIGCMDSRVFSASDEDNVVRLEQHWRHKDFLEGYFRSVHFTALLGAMKLLATSYELVINDGSSLEGALFVERTRNRK